MVFHRQVYHIFQHVSNINITLLIVHDRFICNISNGNDITTAICAIPRDTGPAISFIKADISAHLFHMGGAMALILARFDHNTIFLAIRCRSNTMIQYLYITAIPSTP